MDDTRVRSRAWKRLLALLACVLLSAALAWPPALSGLDADVLQLLVVMAAAIALAVEAHRGHLASRAAGAPSAFRNAWGNRTRLKRLAPRHA